MDNYTELQHKAQYLSDKMKVIEKSINRHIELSMKLTKDLHATQDEYTHVLYQLNSVPEK